VISRDPESWVDIHNHLVPGVDDGARDLPAVRDSVERMTRLGVRRIITTPHFQGSLTLESWRCEARLTEVGEAFELARAAIGRDFPEVELGRGHEVLIDVPEVDFSDARIRLAGTSFVLIEWPRLQIPPGTVRVIQRIRAEGYRPVVAHPERYMGMGRSFGLAGRWRDAGGYLQVNYGSLFGRYGSEAQDLAYRLLRHGWVDYMASDFHGHPSLKLYMEEAWAEFADRESSYAAELLGRTNPGRLWEDQEPMPVPPLPRDTNLLSRLRGALRWERS
jgi:protein-tyrosine phosphatase